MKDILQKNYWIGIHTVYNENQMQNNKSRLEDKLQWTFSKVNFSHANQTQNTKSNSLNFIWTFKILLESELANRKGEKYVLRNVGVNSKHRGLKGSSSKSKWLYTLLYHFYYICFTNVK